MASRAATVKGWESRGLYFATWAPGDGATRYRFFYRPPGPGGGRLVIDYDNSSQAVGTALGWKEAVTFAEAFLAGRDWRGLLSNPGMSTLTLDQFRAQQAAHDWPQGMSYREAKAIHARAWRRGEPPELAPLKPRAKLHKKPPKPYGSTQARAEYERAIRAPLHLPDSSIFTYVNPPRRAVARLYERLRKKGYPAKDAHFIADQHQAALDLGINVGWTEDQESSYDEGAPRWTVIATDEDGNVLDAMGGVDLGEVGPDAHHSDPYQYDAEAQVISEARAHIE
jgi:hypothetical protein